MEFEVTNPSSVQIVGDRDIIIIIIIIIIGIVQNGAENMLQGHEFGDLLEAPNLRQVWMPSNVDLEPDVLLHWVS